MRVVFRAMGVHVSGQFRAPGKLRKARRVTGRSDLLMNEGSDEEESSSLGDKIVSRKKAKDLEPPKSTREKPRGYRCTHAPASQPVAATRHSRPTGVKHKGEDAACSSQLHTPHPEPASETQMRF